MGRLEVYRSSICFEWPPFFPLFCSHFNLMIVSLSSARELLEMGTIRDLRQKTFFSSPPAYGKVEIKLVTRRFAQLFLEIMKKKVGWRWKNRHLFGCKWPPFVSAYMLIFSPRIVVIIHSEREKNQFIPILVSAHSGKATPLNPTLLVPTT